MSQARSLLSWFTIFFFSEAFYSSISFCKVIKRRTIASNWGFIAI